MHRFFLLDTEIIPADPVDLTPLQHQLSRVLRLRPGDQILLLDGNDHEYPTEIVTLTRHQVSGYVISKRSVDSEPATRLFLYQCSLKADKFEWVLQKGTELGVAGFIPVISERSVVRPAQALLKKYDRWRAIIREAAEQSGRGRLPILSDPMNFSDGLDDAQGARFLPWEEADPQENADSLGELVDLSTDANIVSLMIGPEGGLTRDEVAAASASGWHVVTLGPRIFRAETAALASVTITLERLSAFRQQSQ